MGDNRDGSSTGGASHHQPNKVIDLLHMRSRTLSADFELRKRNLQAQAGALQSTAGTRTRFPTSTGVAADFVSRHDSIHESRLDNYDHDDEEDNDKHRQQQVTDADNANLDKDRGLSKNGDHQANGLMHPVNRDGNEKSRDLTGNDPSKPLKTGDGNANDIGISKNGNQLHPAHAAAAVSLGAIGTNMHEEASFGRTVNGTVFSVPVTEDMLKNLLFTQHHNIFEIITLAVLVMELLLYWFTECPAELFLGLFIFWRLSYNAGLGYLLYRQSKDGFIVRQTRPWTTKPDILLKNPDTSIDDILARTDLDFWTRMKLHVFSFLKKELSIQMKSDYNFETVPAEFNGWLLFRYLVDLILINDFTCYFLFAFAYGDWPTLDTITFIDLLRFAGGLVMIAFNWWVKNDAHRVVKDYAWYWGDFFFLLDKDLTFDGVFEMAPHPMYSVGYAGYYGISLISQSYAVLFVSLAAHASQFIFLALVENPHIEKVYGSSKKPADPRSREILYGGTIAYFRRDLIVFKNFDLFRSTDLFTVVIIAYTLLIGIFLDLPLWFYVGQSVAWRFVHYYILGWTLHAQSTQKFWTRHYIKWGLSKRDAFQNWKSIYNLSLTMGYVSFVLLTGKVYSLPENWTYGTVLLRHVLGVLLILLHVWTSASIFEVLGEFGWFYGDFFIDEYPSTLYYTGIYRFLNNPEKIMGHAAFWGLALISSSWLAFGVALFSQLSNFLFLEYVERPHMEKLYGDKVRKESGFTKSIKKQVVTSSLLDEVKKISEATTATLKAQVKIVDERISEAVMPLEQLMDKAKPKIQEIVAETRSKLDETLKQGRPFDAAGDYAIEVLPPKNNGYFLLGEAVKVRFRAPPGHSAKDWVGIYPKYANPSKVITIIPSKGLWLPLGESNEGTLTFNYDHLPWVEGEFEARLHVDNRYAVMDISEPFRIKVPVQPTLTQDDDWQTAIRSVEVWLSDLWSRVMMLDNVDLHEEFRGTEEQAKRIVYGIRRAFGIEFHPNVIAIYPTIAKLSRRLHEARVSLGVPYSLDSSGFVPERE